jgi:DNA-binding beta-propeller fold protein YncE
LTFDPIQHNLFVSGLSGFAVYNVSGTLAPSPITSLTGERGIAFNPENGFVYIGNFSSSNIYAIDETGKVQFNFPMASSLSVVQLVFAP